MYDPMIAKLIVWDSDRAEATRRMLRALAEYEITGVMTLLPFHRALLATEQWQRGETCRDLLEDADWLRATAPSVAAAVPDGSAPGDSAVALDYTVEVSGRRFDVKVIGAPGGAGTSNGSLPARAQRNKRERTKTAAVSGDVLTSPMQGTVLKIAIEPGAQVEEGALVAIIEAMKMENEVTAHKSGTVTELAIAVGAAVGAGDALAVISSAE
jgi:acetyl-CoA/propionyl-CoA carboxylase biotin carboxyl carrier protein